MKTKIRTEVLNLISADWKIIDKIKTNDHIEVTPQELIDLIDFYGGQFLTAKLNPEERVFADAYYDLGISLYNAKHTHQCTKHDHYNPDDGGCELCRVEASNEG